jgi:hypothetical protein
MKPNRICTELIEKTQTAEVLKDVFQQKHNKEIKLIEAKKMKFQSNGLKRSVEKIEDGAKMRG